MLQAIQQSQRLHARMADVTRVEPVAIAIAIVADEVADAAREAEAIVEAMAVTVATVAGAAVADAENRR